MKGVAKRLVMQCTNTCTKPLHGCLKTAVLGSFVACNGSAISMYIMKVIHTFVAWPLNRVVYYDFSLITPVIKFNVYSIFMPHSDCARTWNAEWEGEADS